MLLCKMSSFWSSKSKVYDRWKAGEITVVKAMRKLEKTTFYKLVKKYEIDFK